MWKAVSIAGLVFLFFSLAIIPIKTKKTQLDTAKQYDDLDRRPFRCLLVLGLDIPTYCRATQSPEQHRRPGACRRQACGQ